MTTFPELKRAYIQSLDHDAEGNVGGRGRSAANPDDFKEVHLLQRWQWVENKGQFGPLANTDSPEERIAAVRKWIRQEVQRLEEQGDGLDETDISILRFLVHRVSDGDSSAFWMGGDATPNDNGIDDFLVNHITRGSLAPLITWMVEDLAEKQTVDGKPALTALWNKHYTRHEKGSHTQEQTQEPGGGFLETWWRMFYQTSLSNLPSTKKTRRSLPHKMLRDSGAAIVPLLRWSDSSNMTFLDKPGDFPGDGLRRELLELAWSRNLEETDFGDAMQWLNLACGVPPPDPDRSPWRDMVLSKAIPSAMEKKIHLMEMGGRRIDEPVRMDPDGPVWPAWRWIYETHSHWRAVSGGFTGGWADTSYGLEFALLSLCVQEQRNKAYGASTSEKEDFPDGKVVWETSLPEGFGRSVGASVAPGSEEVHRLSLPRHAVRILGKETGEALSETNDPSCRAIPGVNVVGAYGGKARKTRMESGDYSAGRETERVLGAMEKLQGKNTETTTLHPWHAARRDTECVHILDVRKKTWRITCPEHLREALPDACGDPSFAFKGDLPSFELPGAAGQVELLWHVAQRDALVFQLCERIGRRGGVSCWKGLRTLARNYEPQLVGSAFAALCSKPGNFLDNMREAFDTISSTDEKTRKRLFDDKKYGLGRVLRKGMSECDIHGMSPFGWALAVRGMDSTAFGRFWEHVFPDLPLPSTGFEEKGILRTVADHGTGLLGLGGAGLCLRRLPMLLAFGGTRMVFGDEATQKHWTEKLKAAMARWNACGEDSPDGFLKAIGETDEDVKVLVGAFINLSEHLEHHLAESKVSAPLDCWGRLKDPAFCEKHHFFSSPKIRIPGRLYLLDLLKPFQYSLETSKDEEKPCLPPGYLDDNKADSLAWSGRWLARAMISHHLNSDLLSHLHVASAAVLGLGYPQDTGNKRETGRYFELMGDSWVERMGLESDIADLLFRWPSLETPKAWSHESARLFSRIQKHLGVGLVSNVDAADFFGEDRPGYLRWKEHRMETNEAKQVLRTWRVSADKYLLESAQKQALSGHRVSESDPDGDVDDNADLHKMVGREETGEAGKTIEQKPGAIPSTRRSGPGRRL